MCFFQTCGVYLYTHIIYIYIPKLQVHWIYGTLFSDKLLSWSDLFCHSVPRFQSSENTSGPWMGLLMMHVSRWQLRCVIHKPFTFWGDTCWDDTTSWDKIQCHVLSWTLEMVTILKSLIGCTKTRRLLTQHVLSMTSDEQTRYTPTNMCRSLQIDWDKLFSWDTHHVTFWYIPCTLAGFNFPGVSEEFPSQKITSCFSRFGVLIHVLNQSVLDRIIQKSAFSNGNGTDWR